ncbi:MAG: ATP-binding protein [Eubacteriaceae bacterium]|nr:ATP-binding protein [Eubacteriaceae bacterium]
MKVLRIKANNFKNCSEDFTIDFVAKSRKTSEDKEYELQKIAEDLYVYNTAAFVGKNASGKTTAIELIECCYSLLGNFSLENKHYSYDGIKLEIIFFHEETDGEFIYKYCAELKDDSTFGNKACFASQEIYKKPYLKSYVKDIYSDKGFVLIDNLSELPEDTSILFFVLKKKETRAVYFNSDGEGTDTYSMLFRAMQKYDISGEIFSAIIKIFDENVRELAMVDDHNYRLTYKSKTQTISDKDLIHMLSSGTTKGLLLYTFVAASLKYGFDLLIDEVENHFHKTLVENMINLYKDKSVNKNNATLMFTTHYCEVLDLFNRQDNIWICTSDDEIHLKNMYEDYDVRTELLKSKQFYNNAFKTAVNYNDLMALKKELKK